MKKTFFLMAAAVAMVFASCDLETENTDENTVNSRLSMVKITESYKYVENGKTVHSYSGTHSKKYEWSKTNPTQITCISLMDSTGRSNDKFLYKYNSKGKLIEYTYQSIIGNNPDDIFEYTDTITYLSDTKYVIGNDGKSGTTTFETDAEGHILKALSTSPFDESYKNITLEWKNGDVVKITENRKFDDGTSETQTTIMKYDNKPNPYKNAGHPAFDMEVMSDHNILSSTTEGVSEENSSYTYNGNQVATCKNVSIDHGMDGDYITETLYEFTYEEY